VTQKRPINIQERPINKQKRPIHIQKRTINIHKRPINIQKKPINTQKNTQNRPVNIQQRLVYTPKRRGSMHIFMHFAKGRFRGISSKVHFLGSTLEIFFQCRTLTCGCSRYHFFNSELFTRLTSENIVIALTFEKYLTLLSRERDPL